MLRSLVVALVLAVSVVGCKLDVPTTVVVTPTGNNFLACTAGLMSSPATSAIPATILLKAAGGTAPYTISGNSFGSSTQLIRTYTNNTSSDIILQDSATITDAAGDTASCLWVVNVKGNSTPPSDLACSMTVSPTSPTVNTNTGILVTMTGGTLPRSVDQFLSDSATIVSPMAPITSSTSQAVVKYSTTGLKNPTAIVKDAAGHLAVCSKSFTVNPTASVSAVASPSATVLAGSTISLVASGSGFAGTVTYNFTSTDTNINIVKSGSTALITSKDLLAHDFVVSITATDGSQTATNDVALRFTSNLALSCSVTHLAGTYKVGDEVTFNTTATNGTSLWVSAVTVEDGVVIGPVGVSTKVKFTSAGTKRIFVKAQSFTGQKCNSDAWLEDSVAISSVTTTYTCSVVTAPNPSRTSEYFLAQVTSNLPNAASAEVESIDSDLNIPYGYSNWIASGKNAYVWIGVPGTYQLTFTIRDPFTGNRATCSTQQSVWY